jgi:tetratricopeptide (TPR) repeat protein
MTDATPFPRYIRRNEEEHKVLEAVEQVRQDRQTRAVLLYGRGGVGKTQLVRALARPGPGAAGESIAWLEPIDVDDPEYWLLSNLEQSVANQLDPEKQYFGPYFDHLSQLPRYTRASLGPDAVVSYLGQIKRIFVECYKNFIAGTGKTVVIVFDTVETIRDTYLLLTLTQWMKSLPATLFLLAGRPLPGGAADPIEQELNDRNRPVPVTTIEIGEFTEAAATEYLESSQISAALTADERAKLVRLTRGHPLWLALTISYLGTWGFPEEASPPVAVIKESLPYSGDMPPEGQQLHESLKRRLVSPYREGDFWSESVKRLAVVRQGVNRLMWRDLMSDRPLPPGLANLDLAWERLPSDPWIRTRANGRFVTLHDAVAEELGQRVIPLHDADQRWRRQLWERAAGIYEAQIEGPAAELAARTADLSERLAVLGEMYTPGDERSVPSGDLRAAIKEAADLDARKRELDQLRTAAIFYRLLSDFERGCQEFLDTFAEAGRDNDLLFQNLLVLEMQRFLPGQADTHAFADVVSGVIAEFRKWLATEQQLYLTIGLAIAEYLITNEQPRTAAELLSRLPDADPNQRFTVNILLGNAYLRIPGRVRQSLPKFHEALAIAEEADLTEADRRRRLARAYKELGYYYRNVGLWREADRSYQQARDTISATLSVQSPEEDREELASIQTNWAYVKGLGGAYREGSILINSAIKLRHRLDRHQLEGTSWSVCGEVYRYEKRFDKAWEAYSRAEGIFHEHRAWSWLGLIYQEQAICLLQATQDDVDLKTGADPMKQASDLIMVALDICRDQRVRDYPSALNRAGRIFGRQNADVGLRYLADGIEQARTLSDGWFWFANLIEFAELSYRAWVESRKQQYRDGIRGNEPSIMQAMAEYEFPDLRGRWEVVRGHLAIRDWETAPDDSLLNTALTSYKEGFALIAQGGYIGSSGTSFIPGGFQTFADLFALLPDDIRAEWQAELRRAWSGHERSSTLLLPLLEELY